MPSKQKWFLLLTKWFEPSNLGQIPHFHGKVVLCHSAMGSRLWKGSFFKVLKKWVKGIEDGPLSRISIYRVEGRCRKAKELRKPSSREQRSSMGIRAAQSHRHEGKSGSRKTKLKRLWKEVTPRSQRSRSCCGSPWCLHSNTVSKPQQYYSYVWSCVSSPTSMGWPRPSWVCWCYWKLSWYSTRARRWGYLKD